MVRVPRKEVLCPSTSDASRVTAQWMAYAREHLGGGPERIRLVLGFICLDVFRWGN